MVVLFKTAVTFARASGANLSSGMLRRASSRAERLVSALISCSAAEPGKQTASGKPATSSIVSARGRTLGRKNAAAWGWCVAAESVARAQPAGNLLPCPPLKKQPSILGGYRGNSA